MKPKCDLCGTRHESYQAHVFKSVATNGATNTSATNGRADVGGGPAGDRLRGIGVEAAGSGEVTPRGVGGAGKTRNRRSREAYNAYQREYMRKRRLK